MEVFQGVHIVRLRSRIRHSKYLTADNDGRGICLSGQRGAHNTVWAVQPVAGGGAKDGPYVLLHSAYDRYLLATDLQAATGPTHGVTAIQHNNTHHPMPPGMPWQAMRRRDSFVIRNSTGHYLRANGKYFRWRTAVTFTGDAASTMMQWAVEVVPLRQERPTLVDPPAQLMQQRRPLTEGEVSRVIRYARADADGNFNEQAWRTIQLNTNSLMQLRLTLANRLGQNKDALHSTIYVRAGRFAQLFPLFVDLPIGNDRIDIVVLPHGTPADNALRYLDVDAE